MMDDDPPMCWGRELAEPREPEFSHPVGTSQWEAEWNAWCDGRIRAALAVNNEQIEEAIADALGTMVGDEHRRAAKECRELRSEIAELRAMIGELKAITKGSERRRRLPGDHEAT